jgi:4-hydroxy-3-methylbut-2-enyl diphosphate reductase
VEKVWNRSVQIAQKKYTIVVHGKPGHEETRATFSHAAAETPTVIVRDMAEAQQLAEFITGSRPTESFHAAFEGQYSPGFDAKKDLTRIGVVNQTTMLASDTQAIADFLRQNMIETYGLTAETTENHFADTRDTLCYATLDNQSAINGLLDIPADLAIIVGGYNSSNTSHLVELCEEKMPTYFISGEEKILSAEEILHYNFHAKREEKTSNWLPAAAPASASAPPDRILISSGASCPDALVEAVIRKLAGYYGAAGSLDTLAAAFEA